MTSSAYQAWKEQYQTESGKLIDALGKVTDGGIIEAIQHIGGNSVPGMTGSACVDIGMTVWPFPLEAASRSKLEALGYQIVDAYAESPQQRLKHESGLFQLFLFEPGYGDWYDYVLIGDYLRHNDQVRDEVSAKKNEVLDKALLFSGFLPAARQWWIEHYGFSDLEAIANDNERRAFHMVCLGRLGAGSVFGKCAACAS